VEALPVYLQQPTYLQTAGTAGQCHERTPNRYSKSEAHTLSPADPS